MTKGRQIKAQKGDDYGASEQGKLAMENLGRWLTKIRNWSRRSGIIYYRK